MISDRESLYKLTPEEFEKLCAEILKTQPLNHIKIVGGPFDRDQGVDIIGEAEGQSVAVQIKHTRRLASSTIRNEVNRMLASSYQPKHLIFITSAPISSSHKANLQDLPGGITVQIMGLDDILKELDKHPEIKQSTVLPARKRALNQRLVLIVGILGMVSSIIGGLSVTFSFFIAPQKPPLQERIESVERAIVNLKDLEKKLMDIKEDMVETERAKRTIEEEYAKAKALEKLTDDQFDAVRTALQSQSWKITLLNYLIGFILGIAASLTASVIYTRIRQRRALN